MIAYWVDWIELISIGHYHYDYTENKTGKEKEKRYRKLSQRFWFLFSELQWSVVLGLYLHSKDIYRYFLSSPCVEIKKKTGAQIVIYFDLFYSNSWIFFCVFMIETNMINYSWWEKLPCSLFICICTTMLQRRRYCHWTFRSIEVSNYSEISAWIH